MPGKTLFDKIWDSHVVTEVEGETLVYIDRLLIHERSRHSFSMLRANGLKPYRVEQVLGFVDYYMPTKTTAGGVPAVGDDKIGGMLELMEKIPQSLAYGISVFTIPIRGFFTSCHRNRVFRNPGSFFAVRTRAPPPMVRSLAFPLASAHQKPATSWQLNAYGNSVRRHFASMLRDGFPLAFMLRTSS